VTRSFSPILGEGYLLSLSAKQRIRNQSFVETGLGREKHFLIFPFSFCCDCRGLSWTDPSTIELQQEVKSSVRVLLTRTYNSMPITGRNSQGCWGEKIPLLVLR